VSRAELVVSPGSYSLHCGQFNSTPELLIDDVTVPASLVARDRFAITAHGTMRVGVTESMHAWTARVTFARVR
jgi:hypothetical protein